MIVFVFWLPYSACTVWKAAIIYLEGSSIIFFSIHERFATWATFATFASSGLRYIGDMERHSLHGIKSWQMHTHAYFFAFPQCTIGNQVLSTSTRSASKKIHATACSGIHIGNSNGDRQIGLGEKIPRQTRSVAPPKRLPLIFLDIECLI